MTIKLPIAVFAAASSVLLIFAPSVEASGGYVKGQCTWYAKKRRPDLPSNLGNANTWYKRAATHGFPVGSKPKSGAVGTTTQGALGHVAYVESVHKNGKVTISEMNYGGRVGVVHKRVVVASSFKYIYKKHAKRSHAAPKHHKAIRPDMPFVYNLGPKQPMINRL